MRGGRKYRRTGKKAARGGPLGVAVVAAAAAAAAALNDSRRSQRRRGCGDSSSRCGFARAQQHGEEDWLAGTGIGLPPTRLLLEEDETTNSSSATTATNATTAASTSGQLGDEDEDGGGGGGASVCTLCPGGETVGFPDKRIEYPGFNSSSCQEIDAMARSSDLTSPRCSSVRFVSGICGCPPVQPACVFCGGRDVPKPEYVVQTIQKAGFPPMSCEDMGLFTTQLNPGPACAYFHAAVGFYCGCPLSDETEAKALVGTMRATAVLSILGSLFIVVNVLRTERRRHGSSLLSTFGKLSVYHALMLCMSVFDICSSIAFALGSLVIPKENEYGEPVTPQKPVLGNEGTCTAQGFFLQLGYTCKFLVSRKSMRVVLFSILVHR